MYGNREIDNELTVGRDTMRIVEAKMEDMPRILQIYAIARNFMKVTGNPTQWKNNFPPESLLAEDICAGNLFTVISDDIIHAVFALVEGEEPTYAKIEQGHWISDAAYGTLHRIASDGNVHGVFDEIIAFSSQKIRHLRIDTHENNKVMQHLIEKNGFQKCGIIYVADGSPRIAYEKWEEGRKGGVYETFAQTDRFTGK